LQHYLLVTKSEKEFHTSKEGIVSDATLQSFISRLTRDDRLLELIVIQDAMTANGNANDIAKANDDLSKGDTDVADGKYDNAIGRYLSAWKNALKAVGKA
jgi:hypothetical protein